MLGDTNIDGSAAINRSKGFCTKLILLDHPPHPACPLPVAVSHNAAMHFIPLISVSYFWASRFALQRWSTTFPMGCLPRGVVV